MDVNTFYKKYHRFVKKQANEIIYMYRVPEYLFDDCVNAGYVAVCEYLPRWDASKGANPMTYLYLAIRKEMAGVCRGYLSHRPKCHRVRAQQYIISEGELSAPIDKQSAYGVDEFEHVSIEESIDLNRTLQKSLQLKHRATSHFLYGTFDKLALAECARHEGLTRQAVSLASRKVRERLRKTLGAEIS